MSDNPNSLAGNGIVIDGFAGATFQMTSSNTAQSLASSKHALGSRKLVGLSVSFETNDVRVAFGGAVPTQVGLGHYLFAAGSLVVRGKQPAKTLSFISAAAGAHGVLTITPYYK